MRVRLAGGMNVRNVHERVLSADPARVGALIEDAMDQAERSLGLDPGSSRWSPLVKALRRVVSGGKARPRTVA